MTVFEQSVCMYSRTELFYFHVGTTRCCVYKSGVVFSPPEAFIIHFHTKVIGM